MARKKESNKPSELELQVLVLFDRRIVLGESHISNGNVWYRSTSETIDGFRIITTIASASGHLDISKLAYTFALSTRQRMVPLTIKNIPNP